MYANTAYEALYQLMGLKLQETVTAWITSAVVFRAMFVLVFAVSFFLFMMSFMSKYLPFVLSYKAAPMSKIFKLMMGLFLGLSILKVTGRGSSHDYSGKPWSSNNYVTSNFKDVSSEYSVSYIFTILSGSAEELARFFTNLIDSAFQVTNAQTTSPNFFYKAVLGAATESITDQTLKSYVKTYVDSCLPGVIQNTDQSVGQTKNIGGELFSNNDQLEEALKEIPLSTGGNCLQLKNSITVGLTNFSRSKSSIVKTIISYGKALPYFTSSGFQNYYNATLIANSISEDGASISGFGLGLEKGAQVPTALGASLQHFDRLFSMSGVANLFGQKGITTASEKANELSDHFARAPHMAAFTKLILIAVFPALAFFLAAGNFKPVLWWYLTYLSVCFWNPVWVLMYHVITALTLSQDTLANIGAMGDGISLFAAKAVSAKLYQAYSVYATLQLLVAPTLTGSFLFFMKGAMAGSDSDEMPNGVGGLKQSIATGARVAARVGGFAK